MVAKTRKLTLLATAVIVLGLVVAGFLPQYLVTPQVVLASPDSLTLRPETPGDSNQLTPFPAAIVNWDCVDEVTSDGDSTYVFSGSPSFGSDLHNLANTSQTGSINSVTVWAKVRGTIAANNVAYTLIKTNGVIYSGAAEDVTTGYSDISTTYYQNPQSTAAWTWDEVNLLQAGCSLKRAGPGQQTRCTQVWVAVDHTPPGPPTVDAVALYHSDESTAVTSMDPQVEYAVKVTVTDNNTLDDVNEVKITIFYDSAGTDPAAPGISDTQTCAIITWTKGGSPAWTIDPSTGTTWVLVTASCKTPTMSQTTGDWWVHFKPGKVATQSGAADDWDIYAKATDAAATSDELYARDYEMNWYGEITVNTGSVDWGTVVLGSDFAANEQTGISVTYIANGVYNQQVKASNPWVAPPNQVTLNEGGNPGDGEFSLKAGNGGTAFYDDFEEHNVGDPPDGWSLDLEWGSGTLSVQQEGSNKVMDYTHTVDGAPHIHAGDTAWTDYSYEAKMRIVTGNSHHGLLFRWADRNNTCYCGVSDPTNGIVQLWKRIGGTWTQIGGDWSITPPGNTWHDWKVIVNGTNIKVYWDGAYLGEGNLGSGELISGKIGCFAGYGGQTRYDDFKVYSSKVLVLTSDYTTFDTGTQTGETGNTETSNTLWLKLGPSGIPAATYSGTIYYRIAQ